MQESKQLSMQNSFKLTAIPLVLVTALFIFTQVFIQNHMIAYAAVTTTCTVYEGKNVNNQNYTTYGSKIKSYLVQFSDNMLMRVQAGTNVNGTLIEYYDNSYNLDSSKTKTIAQELPIFGGFYEMNNNYYLLSGQINRDESDSVEVYRITKYDKNWNKLSSCSIYGANTYIPFDAGSAKMADDGKNLIVHTCHEMYQSEDGLHHQKNFFIQVNTDTMSVSYSDNYDWCSHSFNQFLAVENDYLITIGHGDAYPRSIKLSIGNKTISSGDNWYYGCKSTSMMDIPGATGDNYTGVSIGGFQNSDTAYLVAGNCDINSELKYNAGRNIFISVLSKETDIATNTSKATIKWITDYKESDKDYASTPHLVKIGADSYLLLWSKGTKVYYTKIDCDGNTIGSIYSMDGNLSDCTPMMLNNKLVWYTWDNEIVSFYDIDLNTLSENNSVTIKNGHQYVYGSVKDGVIDKTCKICNHEDKEGVVTAYTTWWREAPFTGYYYSWYSDDYDIDDKLEYWTKINTGGNTSITTYNSEMEVISSDSNIVSVSSDGDKTYGILTMKKKGIAKITIRPKLNPTLAQTYTITVGKNISNCDIKLSNTEYTYTGNAIKPQVTVTYNGATLVKDSDYTITYSNNTDAGSASITISGIGDYVGSLTKAFTIDKKIPTLNFTASSVTKTYGNAAFTNKLTKKTDGKITYKSSDNSIATVDTTGKVTIKKAGTVTITATASTGTNYTSGSKSYKLIINRASSKITASSYTKNYGDKSFTLSAKTSGNGKLSYKSDNSNIAKIDGTTGKVTLKGYGKATITITAAQTSQYSKATKKVTVTVKPKKMSTPSVKLPSKGTIQVSWNKDSKASGYQIRYSTKSSMSGTKVVTVKSASTVSKKISGLSKGKKYYVQVRAYKSSYYGAWSSARNITTK